MGNNYSNKDDAFYMHIKFIGYDMIKFYSNFKNSDSLQNIIK